MVIGRDFYNQNTIRIAKRLIGCYLVRRYKRKIIRVMIIETEAYRGEYDLASHASKGRTGRTEIMYGSPGVAYVYMIYGMYFMLNVVTEEEGYPAAVLIRGISVGDAYRRLKNRNAYARSLQDNDLKLSGPGKLTKFLHIDKSFNGHDLTRGEKLWIEYPTKGNSIPNWGLSSQKHKVIKSPRVGIDYARHCREWKWNFKVAS
jgi:DNA-3-methyladenine glycosylase